MPADRRRHYSPSDEASWGVDAGGRYRVYAIYRRRFGVRPQLYDQSRVIVAAASGARRLVPVELVRFVDPVPDDDWQFFAAPDEWVWGYPALASPGALESLIDSEPDAVAEFRHRVALSTPNSS